MSTNHTSKYALSQWLHGDPVLMDDFNEDNRKLDSALTDLALKKADAAALTALAETVAALPRVAVGGYTGTGGGRSLDFTSSLGRPPLFVYIQGVNSSIELLFVQGASVHSEGGSVSWSGNKLTWSGYGNDRDTAYRYFAIG